MPSILSRDRVVPLPSGTSSTNKQNFGINVAGENNSTFTNVQEFDEYLTRVIRYRCRGRPCIDLE